MSSYTDIMPKIFIKKYLANAECLLNLPGYQIRMHLIFLLLFSQLILQMNYENILALPVIHSPLSYPSLQIQPNLTNQRNSNLETDKIDGSGNGPLTNNKHIKEKFDDSEDGDDDDDDDDEAEDYDYKDTSDNGSGHNNDLSSQKKSEPLGGHGNSIKRPSDEDLYLPFRPSLQPNNSTAPNLQLKPTKPPIPSSTSPPPPSSTIMTTTTLTTATTTIENRPNSTKLNTDYDYEEESEDDDSEDTSVFEDNDSTDAVLVSSSKTISTTPTTSLSSGSINSSTADTIKPTVHPQQAVRPNVTTHHSSTQSVAMHTTITPLEQPKTSNPIPLQTSPSRSSVDAEADGEEEEEEEEEEDEEEEPEGGELEEGDNFDERSPGKTPNPNNNAWNNQNQMKPTAPSVSTWTAQHPYIYSQYNAGNGKNNMATSIETHSSSHINPTFDKSAEHPISSIYPSPVTVASIKTTSVPYISSTAAPTMTTRLSSLTFMNVPIPPTAVSSKIYPTVATLPPFYPPTTPVQIQPIRYATTPRSKVTSTTANILAFDKTLPDSDESLTRQLYDKAVDMYHEADKAVRAAIEAVWPPSIEFNSSTFEPLLAQPMFLMRK